MKFIAGLLFTAILSALATIVLPWWVGSLVAFVVIFLMRLTPSHGFLIGLLGVGLAWCVLAIRADIQNGHILSTRIGELFMGITPLGIVVVTALIGGLSGGLGGLTGGLVRRQL